MKYLINGSAIKRFKVNWTYKWAQTDASGNAILLRCNTRDVLKDASVSLQEFYQRCDFNGEQGNRVYEAKGISIVTVDQSVPPSDDNRFIELGCCMPLNNDPFLQKNKHHMGPLSGSFTITEI